MNRPDVDDVINSLSIKFNKIFCERDFVCCVIEDFQTILDNKGRTCVLVFPTLGPIYLKALRYQAKIFDLAVFNITSSSGKFKSIAVCHKDHLKKPPITMSETSTKKKRPERQLYIPPAQRGSRIVKQDCQKNNKRDFKECSGDNQSVLLSLSDFVNLCCFFNPFLCDFQKIQKYHYQHGECEFKKFLEFKNFNKSSKFNLLIKIYNNGIVNGIYWKIQEFNCTKTSDGHFQSYPVFNFQNSTESIAEKPTAVLVNKDVNDYENSIKGLQEVEHNLYLIECDNINCDDEENHCIIDLSVLNIGHFFLISCEGCDYYYECQEKHDTSICYENKKRELEISKQVEKLNSAINIKSQSIEETDKNGPTEARKTNTGVVKNQINNKTKKKVSVNTHEQEKEIMRITKEYINRKTRPIMKYVDDTNDTLTIDKNDSVNNWEDLFDDDGQIQEELLTEIVDKVGDDITIVKASEDYTAYSNKPPEDLEHVVELYNFPATLETHDLVQAFSDINSDAMYIKWVDDTHALLVLGSLTQAQKAMSMKNPLIKVRPMTAASAISMDVANKSDLKPAMKRPPTNLQTARRLITTHLGAKSKLTKEQMAKEKQDLKDAREMKRLIKQHEKDAWEGNIRSSVN